MITGLSIENFKGIREKVEIELRPITLLFGANSAGKSSILHALQYANAIFERRNLDADLIGDGSVGVDLGGFQNFIHGHNPNLDVTLGFNLAFPKPRSFPGFRTRTPDIVDDASSLYGLPKSANVSLTVGWSNLLSAPFVRRYAVIIDEVEMAEIRFEPGTDGTLFLNDCHPIFTTGAEHSAFWEWSEVDIEHSEDLGKNTVIAHLLNWALRTRALVGGGRCEAPYSACYGLFDQQDALPNFERTLSFDTDWAWPLSEPITLVAYAEEMTKGKSAINVSEIVSLLQTSIGKDWGVLSANPQRLSGAIERLASEERHKKTKNDLNRLRSALSIITNLPDLERYLTEAISQVVLGPGCILRDHLVNSRFLGPIREVPQRNHIPSRQQERARWSSGLGAWDRLETAESAFIDAVSHWLGDENRLNSGYRLRLKRFKELDLGDPLVVQLLTGRAFDDADIGAKLDLNSVPTQTRVLIVPVDGAIELRPSDVGVGISQVVPVIVTSLDGRKRLVAIEQPELHIHPRLQAEIADLFLEACQTHGHRFLIETHSEHCLLRLQRRIRETAKGKPAEGRSLMSEDVVVYHVSTRDGGTHVRRIDVDKHGEFVQPWPDDFFEIDFHERFGHDR